MFDNQNIFPLHCLNVDNGANKFMFGMWNSMGREKERVGVMMDFI